MIFFEKFSSCLLQRILKQDSSGRHLHIIQTYIDRLLFQGNDNIETNGEAFFLSCLSTVLPQGSILDVGANVGDWAKIALKSSDFWEIYCFEPNPPIFAKLESANLPASRTHFYCLGLSDSSGHADLHSYVEDSGMSSLHSRQSVSRSHNIAQDNVTNIRLDTLSNVHKKLQLDDITLLKIDVEGHDKQVIIGASDMLQNQKIKAIQFEYGGTWIDSRTFLMDVWAFLDGYGYQICKIAPNGLKRCTSYNPDMENFRYCNYVALAPSITWPDKWVL